MEKTKNTDMRQVSCRVSITEPPVKRFLVARETRTRCRRQSTFDPRRLPAAAELLARLPVSLISTEVDLH